MVILVRYVWTEDTDKKYIGFLTVFIYQIQSRTSNWNTPNWNAFLGSVYLSLTGTVKNVLFELIYIMNSIYFKRLQKGEIPDFFRFPKIGTNYYGVSKHIKTLRRL
jgi:hypothetical protein